MLHFYIFGTESISHNDQLNCHIIVFFSGCGKNYSVPNKNACSRMETSYDSVINPFWNNMQWWSVAGKVNWEVCFSLFLIDSIILLSTAEYFVSFEVNNFTYSNIRMRIKLLLSIFYFYWSDNVLCATYLHIPD